MAEAHGDPAARADARTLVVAALEANRNAVFRNLGAALEEAGAGRLLPLLQRVFELHLDSLKDSQERNVAAELHGIGGGIGDSSHFGFLFEGLFDLWEILHRTLRETSGPHSHFQAIHQTLSIAGEDLDAILGMLVVSTLARRSAAPPHPHLAMTELGKNRRQIHQLNRMIRRLLETRNPEAMYDILERGILDTFHLRSLLLASVRREEGYLVVVRSYPMAAGSHDPVGWRYDLTHPDILCDVARSGKPEVIEGWDPRYYQRIVEPDGTVAYRQRPRTHMVGQTAYFVPILSQGRAIGIVCTASDRSGREVILQQIERMRPFLDQAGATLATVGEIIERKRAEEALRESEVRYRGVFHTSPGGIVVHDRSGAVVDLNEATCEILGLTADQLRGRESTGPRFHTIHEDGTPYPGETHPTIQTLKTGEPRRNEVMGVYNQREKEYRWILINTEPIRHPSTGALDGAVTSFVDITSLKGAENALRESEERIRRIIEEAPLGILLIGPDMELRAANRALCEMLGYEEEEFLGLSSEQVTHPDDMVLTREAAARAIAGQTTEIEKRYIRKDGKEVHVKAILSSLRDREGRFLVGIGMIEDISHRKEAEERLERSRQQLRQLSEHLQYVREEERTRIAREVHDGLGQALTILKMDLAWVSQRLGIGRRSLRERTRSMSELVDATMGEVRRISAELRPSILDDLGLAAAIEWQAKEFERRTGIRCRIQVPGEDTDVGKARSTTLFRIFQEIMTNIARHAGASQVELKLARTARYARLEVHDNGRGITRKEMRDPGALGLLSMRERAMAWGGEVRISGTRGKGTSFRVRIPLESPSRKSKVEPPSPIDGSRRRKERPR